jgi:hypothetical protein
MILFLCYFIFSRPRGQQTASAGEGGGEGGRGEGRRGEGGELVRGWAYVRADASVLPPWNFIMDATVRPSHGRPTGHRPSVRLLSSA